MKQQNSLTVAFYQSLLVFQDVFDSTSLWYILSSLVGSVDVEKYYFYQLILSSAGGVVGCLSLPILIHIKGLRPSLILGAFSKLLCVVSIATSFYFNSLPLFLISKFLGGIFEVSDLVLNTECIYISDSSTINHNLSVREFLYGFCSLVIGALVEWLYFKMEVGAIPIMLTCMLLVSGLTFFLSLNYKASPHCRKADFSSWKLPSISTKTLMGLAPFFIFHLIFQLSEILLPVVLAKNLLKKTVEVMVVTSHITTIMEVLTVLYGLSFAYLLHKSNAYKVRIAGCLILIAQAFATFYGVLVPTSYRLAIMYAYSIYGMLEASYDIDALEVIGETSYKSTPYFCSILALLPSIARFTNAFIMRLITLHHLLNAAAFITVALHVLLVYFEVQKQLNAKSENDSCT